jgi:hypothetical protein
LEAEVVEDIIYAPFEGLRKQTQSHVREALGRAAWGRTWFIPLFQWSDLNPGFANEEEITDPPANDMDDIFADRAQMGSDSQPELVRREWLQRFDEESLIDIPPFVERHKIARLFDH